MRPEAWARCKVHAGLHRDSWTLRSLVGLGLCWPGQVAKTKPGGKVGYPLTCAVAGQVWLSPPTEPPTCSPVCTWPRSAPLPACAAVLAKAALETPPDLDSPPWPLPAEDGPDARYRLRPRAPGGLGSMIGRGVGLAGGDRG
jgi:hypothetical protein